MGDQDLGSLTVSTVQLDATGAGQWIAPRKIKELTLINQSGSSVSFFLNDTPPSITLANQIQVEFEEGEAAETGQIGFVSGPANGTVLVSWE
jgi:hypothetical protein